MYTQLKWFRIIGSHDRMLANFPVFLNPESTPSQHDLNMFMSLFLCDAAKEITTIVHNHTQPDDPNAVFLHLKFSPHFSYKHKNSATERSPHFLLSLLMLWIIIIMLFLCLEKVFPFHSLWEKGPFF